MTAEEISKLDIEQIIRMPNFYSLTSCGGVENALQFEPIKEPYWEIRFIAEKTNNGRYLAFGIEIPNKYYLIHKFKNLKS